MDPAQQPYIEATLANGTPEEIQKLYEDVHPADLAEALEELDDDRWTEVLKLMPAQTFGELIDHIPAIDAVEHLSQTDREYRREALSRLADDELVDLLQELPEEERNDYVGLLPATLQARSRKLMAFPETSAGGRMTTEVATVTESMTIREAIERLSAIKETTELLSRIYVVDERGRLLGKVRLRDLTFNPRDKFISEVMDTDLISIDGYADQEEAARMIAKYDLVALPVVTPEYVLLGLITHDDAMEILEEESTEDLEKISGIQASPPDESYLRTSILSHFRRRFVWVITMALLAIISGFVLYSFEETLSSLKILAIYVPMVVAAGGNTGSQSATMVIRAMSLDEFEPNDFFQVVWKEMRIGVLLGSLLGLCIFMQIKFLGVAEITGSNTALMVGVTVGVSLMAQVMASTTLGAGLPLLASIIRLDPAAVASPAITTLVDVTGMLIYFGLANVLLSL